jgi:hypothetical protein
MTTDRSRWCATFHQRGNRSNATASQESEHVGSDPRATEVEEAWLGVGRREETVFRSSNTSGCAARDRARSCTEAANNLIRRANGAAFGLRTSGTTVRALLYAGQPNWQLLATITPQ